MSNIKLENLFHRIDKKRLIHFSLILILLAMFVAVFLYFDQRYAISLSIQRMGLRGNIIAVLLMALLYMTPIPSEGLLVLCFKIYGIYMGIILSWLGMDLSSIITFFIARIYGQKLVQRLVSPENFNKVDNWVKRKGTLGLLIARLLPVPAFAINCIAGVIPSVEFWPYFWTAAVSIVPYYVGTALVFLGIYSGTWQWLIFGAIAIAVFWAGSYALSRRQL
ncbi:MAG TPA: VTT domain-containing protein [Spirochaetia bacterium]|nr:VTT domain-containing protein [Spirochaetia bacterium]